MLAGLIALLHVYILVLEMFQWTSARAMKAFGTTPEFAQQTRVLAANQGLYNGFLAAGLIWGLTIGSPSVQLFFLSCVAVAGVYGAVAAIRRILVRSDRAGRRGRRGHPGRAAHTLRSGSVQGAAVNSSQPAPAYRVSVCPRSS